ncbi:MULTISPECIES: ChaB family protein [unclassified Coleofasciculus]|uniref:ChaB family protein n=1 Tax=unclassified Coleofasciculus TaxID=2692782 RepID=UPI001880D0D8|nr:MULTISPECIES: ChaB family protein [unclassified Coleofasciculus]MBE9129565.1 ChaB family protein [Coleofasciculus sp. LEGE 07081]MBE9152121.1 ChaB family protein [Coleofasciculus sp. LEGE 07092]
MPFQTLEELPNDVKEKLPQGAQQIFQAAYNSASRDGLNDEQARQVAWNSVKNSYEEGEGGQWHHKAEGGAGSSYTGTMPGS